MFTFLVKNPKKKIVMFFSVLSYGITHLYVLVYKKNFRIAFRVGISLYLKVYTKYLSDKTAIALFYAKFLFLLSSNMTYRHLLTGQDQQNFCLVN